MKFEINLASNIFIKSNKSGIILYSEVESDIPLQKILWHQIPLEANSLFHLKEIINQRNSWEVHNNLFIRHVSGSY